jgi:hypothetical protein
MLNAETHTASTFVIPESRHYDLLAGGHCQQSVVCASTAKSHRTLFKKVILAYIECALHTQIRSDVANGTSSTTLKAIHYKLDVERSTMRVLATPALTSDWWNLVIQYGELGVYDSVPVEVESSIILALSREWERLNLHKTHEYFSFKDIDPSPNDVGRQRGRKCRHGESIRGRVTPEYTAWQNMKSRCTNPKARGSVSEL